jgi:hypothetical protein
LAFRLKSIGVLAAAALAVTLAVATAAHGSFHLNKIREITGDTAGGNQSYIELQMYASGENFVAGHNITVWDADGLLLGNPVPIQTHPLTGPNPPNGSTQSTILIGDTAVPGRDFTIQQLSDYLDNTVGGNLTAAGAICYEGIPVDCVSWGGSNFTGAANLPDHTTPNGSAMPTGVLALQRNIAAGTCATALDAADDTDNAANDFSQVPANPRPNSVPPAETPCVAPGTPTPTTPATSVAKKKKKCKKRKKNSAGSGAPNTGGGAPAYSAKKKKCKKRK